MASARSCFTISTIIPAAPHRWALAEARRALRIAAGDWPARRRKLRRWGWLASNRDRARAALEAIGRCARRAARARAAAAYRAYRLSSDRGRLRPRPSGACRRFCWPRLTIVMWRGVPARTCPGRRAWHRCSTRKASDWSRKSVDRPRSTRPGPRSSASGLRRAARRLLGDRGAGDAQAARDERRGWPRVERQLRERSRAARRLPRQSLRSISMRCSTCCWERRRQQWREACDREPDAFELAA